MEEDGLQKMGWLNDRQMEGGWLTEVGADVKIVRRMDC